MEPLQCHRPGGGPRSNNLRATAAALRARNDRTLITYSAHPALQCCAGPSASSLPLPDPALQVQSQRPAFDNSSPLLPGPAATSSHGQSEPFFSPYDLQLDTPSRRGPGATPSRAALPVLAAAAPPVLSRPVCLRCTKQLDDGNSEPCNKVKNVKCKRCAGLRRDCNHVNQMLGLRWLLS